MNVKKFMGVCLLLAGCLSVSYALTPAQLKNTVTRKAVETRPFVRLSAEKQASFDKLLKRAVAVVEKEDLESAQLGTALNFWVMRAMEFKREDAGTPLPIYLSADEQRAAFYAVSVLIPAQYNVEPMYTLEYMNKHPVQDWAAYRRYCEEALEHVYSAVKAIAEEENGFQYSILKTLTH